MAPSTPAEPTGPAGLPALQRIVQPLAASGLTAKHATFSEDLPAWQDPTRTLAPLGHDVRADAPAGVVGGLAAPVGPVAHGTDVGLPLVQRAPSGSSPRASAGIRVGPTAVVGTAAPARTLPAAAAPSPRSDRGPDLVSAPAPDLPVLQLQAAPLAAAPATTATHNAGRTEPADPTGLPTPNDAPDEDPGPAIHAGDAPPTGTGTLGSLDTVSTPMPTEPAQVQRTAAPPPPPLPLAAPGGHTQGRAATPRLGLGPPLSSSPPAPQEGGPIPGSPLAASTQAAQAFLDASVSDPPPAPLIGERPALSRASDDPSGEATVAAPVEDARPALPVRQPPPLPDPIAETTAAPPASGEGTGVVGAPDIAPGVEPGVVQRSSTDDPAVPQTSGSVVDAAAIAEPPAPLIGERPALSQASDDPSGEATVAAPMEDARPALPVRQPPPPVGPVAEQAPAGSLASPGLGGADVATGVPDVLQRSSMETPAELGTSERAVAGPTVAEPSAPLVGERPALSRAGGDRPGDVDPPPPVEGAQPTLPVRLPPSPSPSPSPPRLAAPADELTAGPAMPMAVPVVQRTATGSTAEHHVAAPPEAGTGELASVDLLGTRPLLEADAGRPADEPATHIVQRSIAGTLPLVTDSRAPGPSIGQDSSPTGAATYGAAFGVRSPQAQRPPPSAVSPLVGGLPLALQRVGDGHPWTHSGQKTGASRPEVDPVLHHGVAVGSPTSLLVRPAAPAGLPVAGAAGVQRLAADDPGTGTHAGTTLPLLTPRPLAVAHAEEDADTRSVQRAVLGAVSTAVETAPTGNGAMGPPALAPPDDGVAPPATPAAPPGGPEATDASVMDALDLDELTRRLGDRIVQRVKRELRLDRDRAGHLTDIRR